MIASSRPSGAMSKSSGDGLPRRQRETGAARARRGSGRCATSQTNTCGSRPSVSQWSQKRNSARSVTCALTFASLRSFLPLRLRRVGCESGHTQETKAIRLPSANHLIARAPGRDAT